MPCKKKSTTNPDLEKKVLDLLYKGEFKSGEIAEQLGVDKKEVDKIIKKLKQEGKIVSPKKCYYTIAK